MPQKTLMDTFNWYLLFDRLLAANPSLERVYSYLKPKETDKETLRTIARFHFNTRLKLFLDKQKVDDLIACIDAFQRQTLGISHVKAPADVSYEKNTKELSTIGYTHLPSVPAKILQEMYGYLERLPVATDPEARKLGGDGKYVHRDIARKDMHVARLAENDILNCPHLLENILSPKILKIVEQSMGATPTLTSITAWWSFANHHAPKEAQQFHMDIEDYRFYKLFFYLTDVDKDSGPHTYIEGTHNKHFILKHITAKSNQYPEIKDWYIRSLRKTDEEVDKYFNIPPTYITGKAGSCFLVDTAGIHKGLLPKDKDRLLVQATFCCTPSKQTHLNPLKLGTPEACNIAPHLLNAPNNYITRLFVQP